VIDVVFIKVNKHSLQEESCVRFVNVDSFRQVLSAACGSTILQTYEAEDPKC
jgi:hypothetical protein